MSPTATPIYATGTAEHYNSCRKWRSEHGERPSIRRTTQTCFHISKWQSVIQYVVYLLNIWEFVYFVWGLSPPIFCTQTRTDHVQNIYWVLCLKGSSLPKMTLKKTPAYRPTDSQRWRVGRLAGWLLPRQAMAKACAINSITINSTGSVWGR